MPSTAPRPDATRARRILATAAVLVVVAQLAVGLLLDAAPPAVRFFAGARVVNGARAAGAQHVLLFGSSRFLGLDVDEVATAAASGGGHAPRVLSGAVAGGDPVAFDWMLARILATGARPALVAVELSPETLARPAPWITDHVIRFFGWREVAATLPEIVQGRRATRALAARFAPIAFYRRELLRWMVGRPPPYLRVPRPRRVARPAAPMAMRAMPAIERVAAPESTPAPKRPDRKTLAGARQTGRWLRHYRIDGIETRSLERLLARCREHDIPVVLIGVPVSHWVRELYTPEVERVFAAYVAELGRRYDVELVDFRARMPDADFGDHHHLNAHGATEFAAILGREALAPRWMARRAAR